MLWKFLGCKSNKSELPYYVEPHKSSSNRALRTVKKSSSPGERISWAVKIVHPGGHSEKYYMAVPALKIIGKYPSFILARPEVFRRPWDPIIKPEEILVPGQKYYVIPRQTLKKLRHRIRKINSGMMNIKSSTENESSLLNNMSTSSILVKPGPRVKARNRHVRFSIDTTNTRAISGSVDKGMENKTGKSSRVRLWIPQIEHKRRARYENIWEPSLNSIKEL